MVTAAEASDKVVPLGLYGTFSGIDEMMIGWHKLEVDTFAVNESFDIEGELFVEHMKDGAEATVSKKGVQSGIGL